MLSYLWMTESDKLALFVMLYDISDIVQRNFLALFTQYILALKRSQLITAR